MSVRIERRGLIAACGLFFAPIIAHATVCDVSWDGEKIFAAISGRPSHLAVPLRSNQQQIPEVTVGQIQAFKVANERIVRAAGLSPSFLICGNGNPNAFAAKINDRDVVGVTVGMMRLVDGDVDMAAAVLGHELAHHKHNHGEDGATRDAALGIAGFLLGLAFDVRSTRRTGVPTNVGQTLGSLGGTLVSRKFDRDQEREADSTGFKYLVDAGFNPNGAVRLADRMNQFRGSAGLFFDSHPGWEERAALFRTMIASSPQAQQVLARSATPSVQTPASMPPLAPRDPPAAPVEQTASIPPAYTVPEAQRSYTNAMAAVRARDFRTAVTELRASVSAGYAPAQAVLGYAYSVGGEGLQKDDVEAVRLLRLSADQGNALGQVNLGVMHSAGRGGLQKDHVEAARLYKLSADQGNALGQANLGYLYTAGLGGLQKDLVEAGRLFKLSADQGNALGQANLGYLYSAGLGGFAKDDVEAVRLYKLAVGQGNSLGQTNLAGMYLMGRGGLANDDVEAARLARLAAAQNNANAQGLLGLFHATGRGGVTKDEVEALRLFRISANSGVAASQAAIGRMYASGLGGLQQDDTEAVKWYRLAASQGVEAAKKELLRRGLQ